MWGYHDGELEEQRIIVKNTTKIRANAFGILAVNGTSIVTFRERSTQEGIKRISANPCG